MSPSAEAQAKQAAALADYIKAGGAVELSFDPPLHLVTADNVLTVHVRVDREALLRRMPMSY